MLNIVGVTLSFIGTILTLATLIFTKTSKRETTWGDLIKIASNQRKTKFWSIAGLVLISIGYGLQLYSALKFL